MTKIVYLNGLYCNTKERKIDMAKLTFVGGIHPYDGKDLSKDKPIQDVLPKGDLVYPLSQHIGAPAKPIVQKGDKVLVVGAGPIGLFALIAAKAQGAEVYVADVLEGRLKKAMDFGAAGTIHSGKLDIVQEAMRITNGNGFDVCVEACGLSVTFLSCIDCAAFAANIILIGNGKKETTFLHSILLKKELNVFGSRNSYASDFKAVIDLIAEGGVNVLDMVSAVYPMDRADEAFKALANNDGSLAKVLIEM